MHGNPCPRRALAFAAFLFLNPDAIAEEDTAVETLIVTASRTPVPALQVGSSVTVLDRDYLEGRQSPILSDTLRGVPGFAVSRGGMPGSLTQLRVRGAEANQVLVLIDGVEANDPAAGGEFNFAHVLADDIERVEIVRGPQSALWGSDALAGVVNILTRQGEPGVHGSAFAEGGSFGTAHAGVSLGGAGSDYGFRLSGAVLDSDGDNISRAGDEDDGYENATLGFNINWRPIPAFALVFSGRRVSGTNEHDGTDFTTGLPADAGLETDFEQAYGRASGQLELFEGRWQHTLTGTITDTDNDNLASGIGTDSTAGRKTRFVYQSDAWLGGSDRQSARHVLSLAFEHEAEDFHQRGTTTIFGDPNQDLDARSHALAGEYRLLFSEQLSVSVGLRHDWNSDFGDDTSWRITGTYALPRTGTRLRAAYGTATKNPTFTERFGFFTEESDPFFVGNPDLQPEESDGWEAGVEQSFAGGRGHLALTWFRQDLEDEINGFVFDPASGVFTALNLDGRSRRHGLEVSGRFGIAPGLEVAADYTWLDATQQDAFTGGQVREVRRPEHNANANLDWRFAGDRARLNLNVAYNGEQGDVFFPPPAFAAVPVTLDEFVLVALAGSWQFSDHVELFGRVENLLDDDYEEVVGFSEPGIGAFAGLRLSFGR
jgi:vitamin B12 transporter